MTSPKVEKNLREILTDLSENTGPIDRVDGTNIVGLVDIRIGEYGLDDVLAVIKGAFDSEVVDIRIEYACHLRLLNGANLALGEENEDRHILLASQTIDGRRASITGCCAHNGQVVTVLASLSLIFAHEEIFKKVTQALERNVFESKGWSVEEFKEVEVVLGIQCGNGCTLRVTEGRVGLFDDSLQIFRGNFRRRDVSISAYISD